MSDKFGWTSDDWDKLTPQARGNLIANLNYWADKRQKEQKKAEEETKK